MSDLHERLAAIREGVLEQRKELVGKAEDFEALDLLINTFNEAIILATPKPPALISRRYVRVKNVLKWHWEPDCFEFPTSDPHVHHGTSPTSANGTVLCPTCVRLTLDGPK